MTQLIEDDALAEAFARYAEAHFDGVETARTAHLKRIHGGASRQTYAVDLEVGGPGGAETRELILRRDPPDSLIDTERAVEFQAYRSFSGRGLPVPEALVLETESAALGAPFFVMTRVPRGAAASPFDPLGYGDHAAQIGQQFFSHLGAIAAVDPSDTPLAGVIDMPDVDACWLRELDYWEAEIDKDEMEPHPVLRAALRKLRRDPPPAAQKLSVVHGDYRSGNFMCDGAEITAILDWEMAHIGDPLEDLAWAMDPLWGHGDMTRVAGMLPAPEAIAIWSEASGLAVDPNALEWWSLFASVKGMAIWISSAKAFAGGQNDDPVLAFSGWFTAAAHTQILAMRMGMQHLGAS